MYDVKPNLTIGFHGCERSVRDKLLMNPNDYRISQKPYDWLGHGGPAFEGAGLFEKSHIQICLRNPNCIQGFFMPREEIDFIDWLENIPEPLSEST